jgi:hypothetical protein
MPSISAEKPNSFKIFSMCSESRKNRFYLFGDLNFERSLLDRRHGNHIIIANFKAVGM